MRVEEADVGMVGVVGAESEGTDRSDGTEGAGGWSQTEATDTADGKGPTDATGRTDGKGPTDATAGGTLEHDPLDDPASLEADARAERVDRVAVLYARITAATRESLAAVAECDRHRDWAAEGFGSCAEWLAWWVGLGRNAANERVRVAHALERLPKMSEAMSRGEVSCRWGLAPEPTGAAMGGRTGRAPGTTSPSAVPVPSATRWSYTWSPRRWPKRVSPGCRSWKTGREFLRAVLEGLADHPIRCATRSSVRWPLGSAETARRLACDSSVVEVTRGKPSRPIRRPLLFPAPTPPARCPRAPTLARPRRRPSHPLGPPCRASCTWGPGSGLPVPGLWRSVHRRASHRALGRRGRDEADQPRPAVQVIPKSE